ncbi:MAG: type II secretion system F family protein [Gammaproteobacteria bacterium]|nr:type II secretion system F family protein [Gammaproteobacteria bacterium]MDH5629896.1 type II secretion system F family protein [Gammaproteobacteria bacterium]
MAVEQVKTERRGAASKKAAKPAKVNTYVWEGTDKKGKKTSGEVNGSNPADIKAQLRKQGITPTKVTKKAKSLFGGGSKPIEPKDIAMFSRQIATMMKAGVPLVQSFEIIGNGNEKESVQKLLLGIKNDIESGNTMADSLRKYPKYFDDLFCDLVDAGEQAGALEDMLDRIATYKEKTEALKSKIKKALSYPISVVVVAVVVTSILLVKVVPQFKEIFEGFGADLPAFTLFVIGISEFMQANWYIFLFAVIGAVMVYKKILSASQEARDRQDKALLKFPVIGEILHKAAVARFSRTLATTFAAGVPLVEALNSAAGASGNALYRDAILKIRNDVTTGMQMNLSMQSTGVFPNMVVQMIGIGEESGAIDAMLSKVADIYEQEVDDAVDGLSALIEPLIMSVLGVVVGGLIVAMYLPIFQMGQAV